MDILKLGNTVAVFAGHQHSGGYHREKKIPALSTLAPSLNCHVHHLTFRSPLTYTEAYSIVEVYKDRIEIIGQTAAIRKTLKFDYIW